ncbi:hypothetical protein BJX64DRAFT_285507 [Aspergillus heterothallicus]
MGSTVGLHNSLLDRHQLQCTVQDLNNRYNDLLRWLLSNRSTFFGQGRTGHIPAFFAENSPTHLGSKYEYETPITDGGPVIMVQAENEYTLWWLYNYTVYMAWSPRSLFSVAEFQGGVPDAWGGVGVDVSAAYIGPEFERVFYKLYYGMRIAF